MKIEINKSYQIQDTYAMMGDDYVLFLMEKELIEDMKKKGLIRNTITSKNGVKAYKVYLDLSTKND